MAPSSVNSEDQQLEDDFSLIGEGDEDVEVIEKKQSTFKDPEPFTSKPESGNDIEKQKWKYSYNEPLSDMSKGLIGWESADDVENPKNWPKKEKLRTMVLVLITAFMIPVASTIFAPGKGLLAKEFNVTNSVIEQFTVSAYVLGFGWGPLIHAPLSELYGRKHVVVISNFLFATLNLGCSEATGIGMFLAFRALSGIFGCAGMVVGAGIISDMYRPHETGRATSLFLLGPIMGPVGGPILGGFISQHAGWRWTFRVMECMGGVMALLFFFVVKETNASILLRKKAADLSNTLNRPDLISVIDSKQPQLTPARKIAIALTRAIKLIVTSPIVFSFAIYMSVAYAYLYAFFTTIPTVLVNKYNWSIESSGLAFLGVGCGTTFSVAVVGSTNDRLVEYLTSKNNGIREPEMRLSPLIFGSILIPTSMFWYGWGVQTHVFWFVLVMSFFPIGAGLLASLIPIQSYLIDLYGPLGVAASATAALNLLRSTAAAFVPLAIPSLIDRLDYGWGYSLLGFLALALCTLPSFFFVKFGKSLRLRFPPHV
ncbi:major facilitator superfamily domain-containing protein [Dipodascopsis uninucleata]